MAKSITKGLQEIAIGEIESDGGVSDTFVAVGYTYRESETTITTADPTVVEYFSNESNTAIASSTTPGSTSGVFSLMKVDEDDMILFLGGTKTGLGTGPSPYIFKKGVSTPVLNRSLRITPLEGRIMTITKVTMSAKINWDLSADGIFLIDVAWTILQPDKVGEPAYTIALPVTA